MKGNSIKTRQVKRDTGSNANKDGEKIRTQLYQV